MSLFLLLLDVQSRWFVFPIFFTDFVHWMSAARGPGAESNQSFEGNKRSLTMLTWRKSWKNWKRKRRIGQKRIERRTLTCDVLGRKKRKGGRNLSFFPFLFFLLPFCSTYRSETDNWHRKQVMIQLLVNCNFCSQFFICSVRTQRTLSPISVHSWPPSFSFNEKVGPPSGAITGHNFHRVLTTLFHWELCFWHLEWRRSLGPWTYIV